jgi:DNA mismatch endonuclease (patch repair protein)
MVIARVPNQDLLHLTDTLTKSQRSGNMRRIRSKNTLPELAVRRIVHSLGYRYRLHGPSLPGKPDLVFRARKKVIFVHGCFWHQHNGCKIAKMPKSNLQYWGKKLAINKKRDAKNKAALTRLGWGYLVIRECDLDRERLVIRRVREFLRMS